MGIRIRKQYKKRSTQHTHTTKDRVTRTPIKIGVNSGVLEGQAVPAPHVAPIVLLLKIRIQIEQLNKTLIYAHPFR